MPTLNMKLERQNKGYTQLEIAEMLNTEKSAVCKWEKGINVPSYGKLKQLEKILGKSIDELLKPVERS